jgi:hypothetical protein
VSVPYVTLVRHLVDAHGAIEQLLDGARYEAIAEAHSDVHFGRETSTLRRDWSPQQEALDTLANLLDETWPSGYAGFLGERDLRHCDTCGRIDGNSDGLDWVNGSCPACDPSVYDDPENATRIREFSERTGRRFPRRRHDDESRARLQEGSG